MIFGCKKEMFLNKCAVKTSTFLQLMAFPRWTTDMNRIRCAMFVDLLKNWPHKNFAHINTFTKQRTNFISFSRNCWFRCNNITNYRPFIIQNNMRKTFRWIQPFVQKFFTVISKRELIVVKQSFKVYIWSLLDLAWFINGYPMKFLECRYRIDIMNLDRV